MTTSCYVLPIIILYLIKKIFYFDLRHTRAPNYVIKLTADEKMTKYRKHGYKSASTSGKYSKVAAAQYLRWSRQNASSDHDYIGSKQGRLDISGYSYK